MNIVTANRDGWTILGRQGENLRTVVRFPAAAEVFEEYPNAEVVVLHQRHGDPSAYPVDPGYVSVSADDHAVEWLIISGDVAQVGRGQVHLHFMDGETVAKEIIYTTNTLPSLGGGSVPEPWESWVAELLESNRRAGAARDDAERFAEQARQYAEILKMLETATCAETLAYLVIDYFEEEEGGYAEAVAVSVTEETLGWLGIEEWDGEEIEGEKVRRDASTVAETLGYLGIEEYTAPDEDTAEAAESATDEETMAYVYDD